MVLPSQSMQPAADWPLQAHPQRSAINSVRGVLVAAKQRQNVLISWRQLKGKDPFFEDA